MTTLTVRALERAIAALEAKQPTTGIPWAAMPDDIRAMLQAHRAARRAWIERLEAKRPGLAFETGARNPNAGPQPPRALVDWFNIHTPTVEIHCEMSVEEIQKIYMREAGIIR